MKLNQGQSDSFEMSSYSEQDENHYKLVPLIKMILTTASIRPFLGTDNDFSAIYLISLCEDEMKGSSISEYADKISFVRYRFVSGPRALNLMQSSAFGLRDIRSDYEQFK